VKEIRNNNGSAPRFELLEDRRLFAAGDLDPTFGNKGKIIAEAVGFPVADIAVQRDGKIVAVGELNKNFAVARLTFDGKLDRTFGGGDGIAQADFGGDRGDRANAVAIQADGKIVVGGQMDDTSFTTLADVGGFAVARFNSDGALDNTFDGNGRLTVDFPGRGKSFVNAVAIQPDGKILLSGTADTTGRILGAFEERDFAVARLLSNGSLDRTFGTFVRKSPVGGEPIRTGKLTIGFGADGNEGASVITLAPGGKIVVGGIGGAGIARFAVARLSSNGTLDSSFGDGISGTGRFNNLALPDPVLQDIQVQPDGSMLLAGGSAGSFAVARLTAAGRLDKSFAGTGHVVTDFGGNDQAKTIRVTREGILALGGSEGKLAMARYRSNGQPDSSFGKEGKVITGTVGGDAILAATLTSDGKIRAYGRSGSTVQYFAAAPKVNVFTLKPNVSENASDDTSLVFTRDRVFSFPTRVSLRLGGTATLGSDYTATGLSGKGLASTGIGSVVIPAGQSFVNVPINALNDNVRESIESIQVSLGPGTDYSLGDRTSQTLDVNDNDMPEVIRVNFQARGVGSGSLFEPDIGLPFAQRGPLAYGWDADNTANARNRFNTESPDFRYDSLNHMQKNGANRLWEIGVPNGTYMVRLVAGDPSNTDSVYRMNLEGRLALSGTPTGDTRFFRQTTVVQVNDGRLTLSNAPGAVNNRINFLEIKSVPPRTKLGPVASAAARLKNAATANIWQKQLNGLFSDRQIDEAPWI
jgi:uncharacterized delta-60 repeat protein